MSRGINKVIIVGNLGQDPETRYLPSGGAVTNASIATSDLFWSKVDIQESPCTCWEWRGAKKPNGYGNVRIDGRYLLAHRVAFELAVCAIPDGLMVCHSCDNPSCCNPRHLLLGTAAANFSDMLIKNRQDFQKNRAVGEKNYNAKLTDDDVIAIRRKYKNKELNQYQLAEKFGVSQPCIGSIVRGETWRHVA